MLNLSELEQFVTFAEQGTLSSAAQMLHMSQPTLTRTMKHEEAAFGVPLFRCRMPASKFLIQTDEFAFWELVRKSALPCFSSNLSTAGTDVLQGRTAIPITDAQANATYYFICRKADAAYLAAADQRRAKLSAAPEV